MVLASTSDIEPLSHECDSTAPRGDKATSSSPVPDLFRISLVRRSGNRSADGYVMPGLDRVRPQDSVGNLYVSRKELLS